MSFYRKKTETRPIIIGGCHRSGTTLVRRILHAHPNIYCGPEVKFFREWHGAYNDDPLANVRYFSTMKTMLPEEEAFQIAGKSYIEALERAATNAGKQRWADKNPENAIFLSDWEKLLGNDWLYVHVARNPLDTLASIQEAGFHKAIPTDLQGRIDWYLQCNQGGLDFQATHPTRCSIIHYDDLVLHPRVEIEKLMIQLGEEYSDAQRTLLDTLTPNALEDPKSFQHTTIHQQSLGREPSELGTSETELILEYTNQIWSELCGFRQHPGSSRPGCIQ